MRVTSGSAALRLGGWGTALVLFAILGLLWHLHVRRLEDALVRSDPDAVLVSPDLVRLATSRAPGLYRSHCAGCHGADLTGNPARGVPSLADATWLYGLGELPDIENTLDYGIRSGHPKSHNITDMPAFGRIGQLSPAEIQDIVEYVYGMSHKDANPDAVRRGAALFMDKGNCYDCHGQDGSGNVDYGAPDLTGRSHWLFAGDRQTLFQSTYNGRHGLCPAWINQLSAVQIRELAVFLYFKAKNAPPAG